MKDASVFDMPNSVFLFLDCTEFYIHLNATDESNGRSAIEYIVQKLGVLHRRTYIPIGAPELPVPSCVGQ